MANGRGAGAIADVRLLAVCQGSIKMTNQQQKLVFLQYLRGIAAMMVVVNHSDGQVADMMRIFPKGSLASGVDIFFVLSGFIICYVGASKQHRVGRFIVERCLRIVPIYWIFTTLTVIMFLVMPRAFRGTEFSIEHYILSLFFIPHVNPATGSTSPLLRLGWTLNCEMLFYFLFALSMILWFRYREAIVSAILLSMVTLGFILMPKEPVAQFYMNDIFAEFVFGVTLYVLYRNNRLRLPPWVSCALMAVGFAMFVAVFAMPELEESLPRCIHWGLPACLVVAGGLALNQAGYGSTNLFSMTGDASYSIYLCHLFPIILLRTVWPAIGLPVEGAVTPWLFLFVAVAGAWMSGVGTYFILEKPIMQLSHRVLATHFAPRNTKVATSQAY
jgi:exopolysaccharide production protein ExoZ